MQVGLGCGNPGWQRKQKRVKVWVCECSCLELEDLKICLLTGLIRTIDEMKDTGKAAYPVGRREGMMGSVQYYDIRMIVYLFSLGGLVLKGLMIFLVLV